MIGSIGEFQNQMAEQERRRQEAAAQRSAQPAPPAVAAPVAASIAGAMPQAGYTPASALKGAEPGIAKRKKKDTDRIGRDLRDEDPGQGPEVIGSDDAQAAKGYRERGATEGPGDFREPARPPAAEAYDRPYLEQGHAAESPAAEPPRQNPVPHAPQGIPQPIALPGAVTAGYVPAHIAAAYSLGSPSDR